MGNPLKMVIFNSYVKLPEGLTKELDDYLQDLGAWLAWKLLDHDDPISL